MRNMFLEEFLSDISSILDFEKVAFDLGKF